MMDSGLADAFDQLLFGELAVFQEGIDLVFDGLSDRFHQLEAPLFSLFNHIFRNFTFNDVGAEIIGVNNRLVVHKVDDSFEFALSSDRQLDRGGIGFEPILDLLVDLEEVGTGPVHLVDEHDPGHVVAVSLTPNGF